MIKDNKSNRYVIKDIDTKKILEDSKAFRGQTISIPKGYHIIHEITNELDETWYYVRLDIIGKR